jgi:hypothetical protein
MLSSAPKYVFLIFAMLLNIPQIIFLQVSFTRYSFVNLSFATRSFPYFDQHLQRISYERRGYWINKYFCPILAFGTVVGLTMIILNSGIYASTLSSTFLPASYIATTLLVIAAAVVALLIYMCSYMKGLKADIS